MRSGLSQVLQHLMKSGSECTWLDIEDRLQKFYLYVSGVFAESARAKETFGDMNKARIYLDEQRIRGVDPVSKGAAQ